MNLRIPKRWSRPMKKSKYPVSDEYIRNFGKRMKSRFSREFPLAKLDNDDKGLTANTVNSFQRAWATPERANNVPHFLLHHDYFNLLRGACAQH